ncbi:hypothetical protein, partial [Mesorhizobium sp. BHbdii]
PGIAALELRIDDDPVRIDIKVLGSAPNQRRTDPQPQDGAVRVILPVAIEPGGDNIDVAVRLDPAVMFSIAMARGVDRRSDVDPKPMVDGCGYIMGQPRGNPSRLNPNADRFQPVVVHGLFFAFPPRHHIVPAGEINRA